MKMKKELLREICEYMGSDLDSAPCRLIREHMDANHNCEEYIDKIKKTIEIYRVADKCEELPEKISKKLIACLHLNDLPKPCGE